MVWLFLIATLLFVLGGLLAVQPTKAQKRIAALRETAMQAGLHVKLPVSLKFPEGVSKSESAYYCKSLGDRKLSHPFVHVLRSEYGLISRSGKSTLDRNFEEKLNSLPEEFNALYLGGGLIGISWNEEEVYEVPETLLKCLADMEASLISAT